jgi:DNA-binding protein HU-beta
MNKSELIDAIASTSGLSKADAGKALNAITGAITGAMASGDGVQLTGFGSFVVRDRAARTGRNPQTGAAIQIKASKVAAFKAGKALLCIPRIFTMANDR